MFDSTENTYGILKYSNNAIRLTWLKKNLLDEILWQLNGTSKETCNSQVEIVPIHRFKEFELIIQAICNFLHHSRK